MAEIKEYEIAIHFVNGKVMCVSFDTEEELEQIWEDLNDIGSDGVLYLNNCIINFKGVLFVEKMK